MRARLTVATTAFVALAIYLGVSVSRDHQAEDSATPRPGSWVRTPEAVQLHPATKSLPNALAAVERASPSEASLLVHITCGGEVVMGAEVAFLAWTAEIESLAPTREGIPDRLLAGIQRAIASQRGTLSIPQPAARLFIAARGADAAPHGAFVEPGQRELTLELPPGHVQRGFVRDFDDRPLKARVVARRATLEEWTFEHIARDAGRYAGMLFETAAETDDQGDYELRGLAKGRNTVTALCPGYLAITTCELFAPSDGPLTFYLAPAGEITGVVVDATTSEPIENARVASFTRSHESVWAVYESEVVRSDEHGRFRFDHAPTEPADVGVRASKSGHASAIQRVSGVVPGQPRDVVLSLGPPASVTGVVRDTFGVPLPAAYLHFKALPSLDLVDPAQAGPGGAYTADFLEAGVRYNVAAYCQGYASSTKDVTATPGATLDFDLAPLCRLEGRAIVDQYPLENARVRVTRYRANSQRVGEAWVDVDPATGAFRLADIEAGECTVEVFARDFAPARRDQVVFQHQTATGERSDGVTRVELALEPGIPVRGRVFEQHSLLPVSGAEVTLVDWSPAGTKVGLLPVSATTDSAGGFELAHVLPGRKIGLAVDHPPYARESVEVWIAPEQPAAAVDIPVTRGGGIAVTLIGVAGQPLPRFKATASAGAGRSETIETEEGIARFERVVPGTVQVRVVPRGGDSLFLKSQTFVAHCEVAPDRESAVEFRCDRGGVVRGQVLGWPAPIGARAAYVYSSPVDRPDFEDFSAGVRVEDGRFEIVGVAAGRRLFRLNCRDDGPVLMALAEGEVREGEVTELRFELEAGGFSGRVTTGASLPIAGAKVAVIRLEGDTDTLDWAVDYADGSGAYAIGGRGPASYAMRVTAPGYARFESVMAVPDPPAVVERDVQLDAEARIELTTLDPEGRRIAPQRVTCDKLDGKEWRKLVPAGATDDLRTVIAGAEPGSFRVTAEAGEWFPAEAIVRTEIGRTSEVVAQLRRRGSVEIEAHLASGAPAAGRMVELLDSSAGGRASAWWARGWIGATGDALRTDADGRLRLDGLPEGTLLVQCGDCEAEVVLVSGEVPKVTLTIP